MADPIQPVPLQPVNYFRIQVPLPDLTVDVFASNDDPAVSSWEFQTESNPTRDVIDEIFAKLIRAIHKGDSSIDLNIRNGKWIVRDPSFPVPDMDHLVALALNNKDVNRSALVLIKAVVDQVPILISAEPPPARALEPAGSKPERQKVKAAPLRTVKGVASQPDKSAAEPPSSQAGTAVASKRKRAAKGKKKRNK
jgi:hypothetical protein